MSATILLTLPDRPPSYGIVRGVLMLMLLLLEENGSPSITNSISFEFNDIPSLLIEVMIISLSSK